jgi:anti-sigma28 factor (negative regulator of flagellin synthesis)
MRVNDGNTLGSAALEAGRIADTQKSDRTDKGRAGAADQSNDRVEFSASLSQLSRAVSVDSARRSTHVQALAGAYQAGTYQPDSLGASRGLIAEAAGAGRL